MIRRDGSGRHVSIQHILYRRAAVRKSLSKHALLSDWLSRCLSPDRYFAWFPRQSAQPGGLKGSGHAAAAFDGVADTADLDAVAPGHGGRERLNAPARSVTTAW